MHDLLQRFRAGLFPAVSMDQIETSVRNTGTANRSSTTNWLHALEGQLQRELHQARIPRALHAPEITSIGEVAVGLKELSMVERVKQFASKLQFESLADRRELLEADFPVIYSWATADGPGRVANGSGRHGIFRECIRIESQVSRTAGIELVEWRGYVGLSRRLEIEAGLQLDVVLLCDSDREAGLECGDA